MANYDASQTNKSNKSVRTFKDLNLDFARTSVTNDVVKIEDVEAIKRSVRNLVNTNFYERPFHPEIGSSVRDLLFEPITPLTSLNLQRKVEEVLNNFEPRIRLVQVLSRPDADLNRYSLRISFYVIGTTLPVTVETFLERLR